MQLLVFLVWSLALPVVAFTPDDADEMIQYIDGLHERGIHDMVVREAEDFFDDFPGHDESNRVRYRLATSLYELDRKQDASPHFRRLTQDGSFEYRAEAALRLGQCELESGRFDDAESALRIVVDEGADYLQVPAEFLLGECALLTERFDDAVPHYEAVLRRDANGPYARDARSSLAWCAFRVGDHEGALARANDVLSRDPPAELELEMRFLRGEALLELKRHDEARGAYAAVSSGAFADAALRGLGFAAAGAGDHAAAADAFARLANDHPDSRFVEEAALQEGIQRLQAGDAEGASRALGSDRLADDSETLYWQARADTARGRHEEALKKLDRAVAKGTDEDLLPHIHTARGDVLTSLGRTNTAALAYEQAGSTPALHAAAVTRLNAGEAEDALRLVSPLLQRPDADASVRLTQAEALFALERYDEAQPAYQQAAGIQDAAARERIASRIAWCDFLSDRPEPAAAGFQSLAEGSPDSELGQEARFMAGRAHQQLGDTARAVDSWSRYSNLRPPAPRRDEALFLIFTTTHETAPSPANRRWLELLLTDHPDSAYTAQSLLLLADDLSAAGECAAAEGRYRELVERFPDDAGTPAGRYGLAFCQVERGANDEAIESLEPLVRRSRNGDGPSLDPSLRAAALELVVWCHHGQQDPEAAEKAWRELESMDVDPGRLADSARTVAAAWRAADRPDRALDLLDHVGSQPGYGSGALVEGAWIAMDEGANDVAAERLELALEQESDSAAVAEACFFLAEAFFAAGDDEQALPFYAAAADAEQGTLTDEALYKQGFAHLRLDQLDEASACFQRLVQDHPDSELVGETLFLEGEAAFRAGRYQDVVPPLARLLDDHPGHDVTPKARFRLGVALAELGRWDDAERTLARLVQQTPDFPNLAEAELTRGHCLAKQQQERAAQSAYERVIELDKGVLAARARLGLGTMRYDAGDVEDALSEFLKVALLYAHDEEVANALYMAGQCLEQMGQTDGARERYREILDDHPETTFAGAARERLQAL